MAVIENGPTRGNPYGHTALATTGEGVYSFGNNTAPGSSLSDYIKREAPRRNTTVYVIKTKDKTEDAKVLDYLKGQLSKPMPALNLLNPGSYGKVKNDNCSVRSNNALDKLGVPKGSKEPNYPGSAGQRASDFGATPISIPKGSDTVPSELSQFEPTAK